MTLAYSPLLPEARADPEQDAANLRHFQENKTKIMALVDDHEPLTPLEGSLVAALPIDGEPSLPADCIAAGLEALDSKEGGRSDAKDKAGAFSGCLRDWLSRAALKYGRSARGRGEKRKKAQDLRSTFDSKFAPEYLVRLDLKLYGTDGPLWVAYSAEKEAMAEEARARKWRVFVETEIALYRELRGVPEHSDMVPQIKDPVESLKKAEERVRLVLDMKSAGDAALTELADKMKKISIVSQSRTGAPCPGSHAGRGNPDGPEREARPPGRKLC